jgi:hypothetical protein
MLIQDLLNEDSAGYHDDKSDGTALKIDDSRKTRLTLAHINQLRKSHDVRKIEHEKKLKSLSKQYKSAPEAGMPGLGM